MTVDWRLYYVTDPSLAGGRDKVASTVEQAVLGGATVVQFRDKEADDQAFRQGVLACQKAIERAVTKAQPARSCSSTTGWRSRPAGDAPAHRPV